MKSKNIKDKHEGAVLKKLTLKLDEVEHPFSLVIKWHIKQLNMTNLG